MFILGPATLQTSPVQPITDFLDASEVRNLVHLKEYFKGSSNLWDNLLDGVMHHDIALCALGGLISHLSRLMVSLPVSFFFLFSFFKFKNKKKVLGASMCCL